MSDPMMNNNQCSAWPSKTQNQWAQAEPSQSSYEYLTPVLLGFLLGALLLGVVLATFLTLFLQKRIDSTTSVTTASSTMTISGFNINLITNGDGESGPCESGNGITSPSGWSFSGPITAVSYNNTNPTSIFIDQMSTNPGPSNRGQCYFFGHQSASTSMWQTINFSNQIDPLLIDSQTVKFNMSAWMGGINIQDDSVIIILTFIDTNNQIIGNSTVLGPVLASARGNQSLLIFQQTTGIVPVGARTLTLLVTINRAQGLQNNGDVDNISLILYQ